MARDYRLEDPEDRHDWSSLTVVFGEDGAVWQHRMELDAGGSLIFTFQPEPGVARLSERFNTAGALTERTVLAASGAREVTLLDSAGEQPWSSHTSHLDALGHVTAESILADDGSRAEVTFDPADGAAFAKIVSHYTACGALERTDIRNDDGSRIAIDYDTGDAHAWQTWTSRFDAGNHLVQQIQGLDDGSRVEVSLDPTDSAAFAKIVARFTAEGAPERTDIRYDDGSRDAVEYDTAGTRAWSSRTSLFDAENHLVQRVEVGDDGSQRITHFDVNDSYDWTVWTSTVKDGVRTEWFDYDDGLGSGPIPVWPDARFKYSRESHDVAGHTIIISHVRDNPAGTDGRDNIYLDTRLDPTDLSPTAARTTETYYPVANYKEVVLFDEGGSYIRNNERIPSVFAPPNPTDLTIRDAHERLVLQIDQTVEGIYGSPPNDAHLTMEETLGAQRWAETRNAEGEVTHRFADLDNGLRISLDYSHVSPDFISERIMLTDLASGTVTVDISLTVASENFHSSALTFA